MTIQGILCLQDIDRLLGVLKYHGSDLTLDDSDGKLRIKSGSKQTTIIADHAGSSIPSFNRNDW